MPVGGHTGRCWLNVHDDPVNSYHQAHPVGCVLTLLMLTEIPKAVWGMCDSK